MAKPRAVYLCAECGAESARWAGRCETCGAWNSITEEAARPNVAPGRAAAPARGKPASLLALSDQEAPPARLPSGDAELDRALGGGLTQGSALLVGGDPGIGKSTLLLQAASGFAAAGAKAVYVTGEEAAAQVRMRAQRLGLAGAPVSLAAETDLARILAMLEAERPAVAVIDSIQTLWTSAIESAPGSVSQVRACAQELTAFAKRRGCAVALVGHVTKEGQIAGPRVVEHMVDTVLYFEGERGHRFRILRAVKNRFGPADEIGVFEMTGAGLKPVANPSALFLSERGRDAEAPGAAVFAGIEGTRPVLCEIQALVAPAPYGAPRRSVVGWDGGRLAMLLAVLEARGGARFSGLEVYLNVAGGLRIGEPAADLAVAAALLSAMSGQVCPADAVVFGEISLSGAVRPVAQTETRLKEAAKLGFSRAYVPSGASGAGMAAREIGDVAAFIAELFPEAVAE